jgi:thiol:disulfide interchange protein DsbD
MRTLVAIFLCLFAAARQADAVPPDIGPGMSGDAPNGDLVIYREVFSRNRRQPLPGSAASPAADSSGPASGRDILLVLTLVPPADSWLYGPESTEGPPTSVQVRILSEAASGEDVRSATDAPARGTSSPKNAPESSGVSGGMEERQAPAVHTPLSPPHSTDSRSREERQAPAVHAPPAVPKRETRFAAPRFPGREDDNTLVYAGPAAFWTLFPAPDGPDGLSLRVDVSALLCSANSCRPVSRSLDLVFSPNDLSMLPRAEDEARLNGLESGKNAFIPLPAGILPEPAPRAPEDGPGVLLPAPAPSFAGGSGPGASGAGDGTGGERNGMFASLRPELFRTETEIGSLGEALLFGFAAGLILNLMPCVLPVISIKFSALSALSSIAGKKARRKMFREHCLLFAAGIATWFCISALLLGVAGRLWGDLFQQPAVPAVLGLVLFLLALSLFGVFYLPVFDFRIGSDGHPRRQAFAGGLLATLLATPCSGPLLGAVLAWAVDKPLFLLAPAVFSVGLGMASPYLLMALNPRLAHLLPKPGPWTLRLEQLLGFLLMGSVVYISTLLPEHWVAPFLYNLLAVAAAAWLWGSIGHLRAGRTRRYVARAAACCLLLVSVTWGLHAAAPPDRTWEKFNAERFLEDLGKYPMLLDFTADWCPSCKALEYATLSPGRMEDLRGRYNVRTIKVDLTRDAAAGNELLKALRGAGIPLLALFPAGEKAFRPVILRDLVTPGQLREAARVVFSER